MKLFKKGLVVVAAVALLVGVAVPAANAMTTSQLVELLTGLGVDASTAQVVAAAVNATEGSSSSSSCYSYTRDLTVGSTGADVTALQEMLVASGDLMMPAGVDYGYFGSLTQSALASWQADNGVAPAAGYFGPVTKAKVDSMCVTTDDMGDDSDSSSSTLGSGEATIKNFDLNDDQDEVAEGNSEVIGVIEFDVEDGDVMLERIDITLTPSDTPTEDDAWDAFDEIALIVDGDEIASEDVSSKSDWKEDDSPYEFRFSGLDAVFMDGDSVEIEIEITANDSVDDAGTDAEWELSIESDDMRLVDGEGINQYVGDGSSVTFDIVSEGADDDLELQSSDDEILEDTIIVATDDKETAPIFAFLLDANDSDNDIDINEIEIDVVLSSSTAQIGDLVNDFYIEVANETIDADAWSSSATGTLTLTFDVDGDVTVDADSEEEVVLFAEFEEMESDSALQGVTITASLDTDQVDAEGADDVTLGGSDIDGEAQTIRSQGIVVSTTSDADSTGTDNTIGEFTFDVNVAAYDENAYVELAATRGTTESDTGFNVVILDGSNDVVTTGTTTFSLDSEKDATSNDRVKVSDGSDVDFTVTVYFEAATAGSYKALLYSVNYNDTDADADTQEVSSPESDYRTTSTYVETN